MQDNALHSWGPEVFLYALAFTVVVFLFMGPAFWSSTNEFMITRLWRRLRGRPRLPPAVGPRVERDDPSDKQPPV